MGVPDGEKSLIIYLLISPQYVTDKRTDTPARAALAVLAMLTDYLSLVDLKVSVYYLGHFKNP